ncbi:hypothetical protein OKW34_002414 [Paraburkholderia youngii]
MTAYSMNIPTVGMSSEGATATLTWNVHSRERGDRSRQAFSYAMTPSHGYRGREPVLDSRVMSYWRKFILVVLLALSLPVQSFAAVSMICAASETVDDEATTHHVHLANPVDGHALVSDVDGHHGHDHSGVHHPHGCLTCASCCVAAAIPVVPAVSASADLLNFPVPLPPAARVASFLTGGIERPPRLILV